MEEKHPFLSDLEAKKFEFQQRLDAKCEVASGELMKEKTREICQHLLNHAHLSLPETVTSRIQKRLENWPM